MPAKLVQIRRGTTLDHSVFIGKQGEITVDLDKDTLVVHDEQKQGGWPLAKESMANVIGKVGAAQLKFNGTPIADQFLQIDSNGELLFSNIAPFAPDIAGTPVGGDLSGTVGNAEINSDTIGITELDVVDGIDGQYLTTNGAGVLSFTTDQNSDVGATAVGGDVTGVVSNIQLSPNVVTSNELASNSVGITELDVSSGIEGQLLAIDGSGNLEFITNDSISIDVGATAVGGDVTGTVSNIQLSPNVVTSNELTANSVGINEINVSDGQQGQVLTTNGSGVLSFGSDTTSGKILQVVSKTVDAAFQLSGVSSTNPVDIAGFNIDITPSQTNSKILIQVSVTLGSSSTVDCGFRMLRGTTPIAVGSSSGAGDRTIVTSMSRTGQTTGGSTVAGLFLDSPGTQSVVTYKIQAAVLAQGNQIIFVNSDFDDADIFDNARAISTITVTEISG